MHRAGLSEFHPYYYSFTRHLCREAQCHEITFKVVVEPIMEVGPGPEVYELDVVAGGVDDDVLVLDVSVEDAAVVAQQHRVQQSPGQLLFIILLYYTIILYYIPEQLPRSHLTQCPVLADVVEQVLII